MGDAGQRIPRLWQLSVTPKRTQVSRKKGWLLWVVCVLTIGSLVAGSCTFPSSVEVSLNEGGMSPCRWANRALKRAARRRSSQRHPSNWGRSLPSGNCRGRVLPGRRRG